MRWILVKTVIDECDDDQRWLRGGIIPHHLETAERCIPCDETSWIAGKFEGPLRCASYIAIFELAERRNLRLRESIGRGGWSGCRARFPITCGGLVRWRTHAPRPRSSTAMVGWKYSSPSVNFLSQLCSNHSHVTTFICQFTACSYFFPEGIAAMRWVTFLVKSPWYSAPLCVTVSWMYLRWSARRC